MKKDMTGIWLMLQQWVNPPGSPTSEELLAVQLTILTKDSGGAVKFNSYTMPMKEPYQPTQTADGEWA